MRERRSVVQKRDHVPASASPGDALDALGREPGVSTTGVLGGTGLADPIVPLGPESVVSSGSIWSRRGVATDALI